MNEYKCRNAWNNYLKIVQITVENLGKRSDLNIWLLKYDNLFTVIMNNDIFVKHITNTS